MSNAASAPLAKYTTVSSAPFDRDQGRRERSGTASSGLAPAESTAKLPQVNRSILLNSGRHYQTNTAFP
jgi:hypothetical protein